MAEPLQVVVNEELILDAGWWEETDGETQQRVIHPPRPISESLTPLSPRRL